MSGVGWRRVVGACVALLCGASCSSTASPARTERLAPRHIAFPTPASSLPRGFTASIELPATTLVAGRSIQGRVVVHNPAAAFYVSGCHDYFKVALESVAIRPDPPWLSCYGVLPIPRGTSIYPVTVCAAWCVPNMGPPSAAVRHVSGPRSAPLPPGTYRATLFSDLLPTPTAPPVRVRVVASTSTLNTPP